LNTILVYVGLDLVGDGVMKLPFLASLRGLYPEARITWLAGQGKTVYAGVLAPLTEGLLDEVIDDGNVGVKALELLRRPLGGRAFDLVIDTQRRVMTSLILKRIRHKIFISAAADWRLSEALPLSGRHKRPSMLGQMMALLEAAAGRTPPAPPGLKLDQNLTAAAKRRLPDGPIYVGLAPGAGGKHKCWPLERFIAVGGELAARGLKPVFLIGPAEREWEAVISGQLPDAIMPLTDQDQPPLTIALAGRLAAAVANDSGTGHMLAAGGAPLVSLFGPTAPEKFAPFAERLVILRAQEHGGQEMSAIPQSAVIAELEKLLASTP